MCSTAEVQLLSFDGNAVKGDQRNKCLCTEMRLLDEVKDVVVISVALFATFKNYSTVEQSFCAIQLTKKDRFLQSKYLCVCRGVVHKSIAFHLI